MNMLNKADTRVKLVDPKLQRSGWIEEMIEREKAITRGMIINDSGSACSQQASAKIIEEELEKLVPSILDKAFKGEL